MADGQVRFKPVRRPSSYAPRCFSSLTENLVYSNKDGDYKFPPECLFNYRNEVQSLYLNLTLLGDDYCCRLAAEILAPSRVLTSLYLGENNTTITTVQALAFALLRNVSLGRLALWGIPSVDEGRVVGMFARTVRFNPRPVDMELALNTLGHVYPDVKEIAEQAPPSMMDVVDLAVRLKKNNLIKHF